MKSKIEIYIAFKYLTNPCPCHRISVNVQLDKDPRKFNLIFQYIKYNF